MLPKRFTVRAYGILRNKKGEILLSREKIDDFAFTKFPGGGVEFGEGPEDCVVREFMEETGLEVFCSQHIYTNGKFIQNALDTEEQVIGIYYLVELKNKNCDFDVLDLSERINDFRGKENTISHIWQSEKMLQDNDVLTFEMDKMAWQVFIKDN